MMNKWCIHIFLNSGQELVGRYDCVESNSEEVIDMLFNGNSDNDFVALYDVTKTHILNVRVRDISAIDISVFKEEV